MNLKTILLALTFFFLSVTSVFAQTIKWHPGHYVMLVGDGKNSSYYMDQIYRELDTHSAIRGIAIRYKWSELEKSKGVYDFTNIDKQLANLKTKNKQLIILLEVKSFKSNEIRVPKYLQTAEYEGGIFAHGNNGVIKGYNAKLWNNAVYNRYLALITAVGKHLDGHPNFEGFGLQETVMGNPIKPLTSTQINGYYNNLVKLNEGLRVNFTKTMTFQLANYPRTILPSFISSLVDKKRTLGATDIFLQEPGLFFKPTKYSPQGLYLYFPELNGTIPLLAQVEKSNYEDTKHDGTGYKPSVTELFNFGKDKLFANYILWTRSPEHFNNVLMLLNQKSQLETPSGGLISRCPINFTCTN